MLICIIGRAELFIAITQVLAQKSGVNEYFVTEYSFSFIYMEKCTTQCTSVNQLHVVCHASMTTPPTAPCTSGNCAVQNNRNTWIRYISAPEYSVIFHILVPAVIGHPAEMTVSNKKVLPCSFFSFLISGCCLPLLQRSAAQKWFFRAVGWAAETAQIKWLLTLQSCCHTPTRMCWPYPSYWAATNIYCVQWQVCWHALIKHSFKGQ